MGFLDTKREFDHLISGVRISYRSLSFMISTLTATHIQKSYSFEGIEQTVLSDINLTFTQGQLYAITGSSGSGKSTLLHLLGGVDTPTAGKILFNAVDINAMRQTERTMLRTKNIGFVFQFHYLIRELSVIENVALNAQISGINSTEAYDKASQLLDHVGLRQEKLKYPHQLSGGQQERVAVVRALINSPTFILADEPTGNLDAHNAQALMDLLLDCHKQWGPGIIIATHDAAISSRMTHVLNIKDGVIL